jgi:hypothetical protein
MGVSKGLLSAVVAIALSGCVWPEKFTLHNDLVQPTVCQVGAAWNNKVLFVPDPTKGGVPAPGLTGRLYLFGAMPDYPFIGDGSLVVDLFDDTPRPGETPVQGGKHIEQWRIDPVTLKRLAKKDTIGDGYTLFLPWGTYKPEIQKVHLITRYEPAKGNPIFASPNSLMLDHGTPPPGYLASQPNQVTTESQKR